MFPHCNRNVKTNLPDEKNQIKSGYFIGIFKSFVNFAHGFLIDIKDYT